MNDNNDLILKKILNTLNQLESQLLSPSPLLFTQLERAYADIAFKYEDIYLKNRGLQRDLNYNKKAALEIDPELNTPLTENELNQINDFWAPYSFAVKNDPETQRIFSRTSGTFNPAYLGHGFVDYYLKRFFHDKNTFWLTSHKNFLQRMFPIVKHPYAFIHKSWGQYYNSNYYPISQEEALDICINTFKTSNEHKEMIIKPALPFSGGEGKGISFIDNTITREKLEHIFIGYPDFICQEIVKNHPSFSAPYSNSLNTLRVVSILWKNEVIVSGAVFRMGTDKRIDNLAQGGLSCGVSDAGVLNDFATNAWGKRYYSHPSGFKFSGHMLYKYSELIDTAKKLHLLIPQQKIISWDFTVDINGEVVLIEINSAGSTEIFQHAGKHFFKSPELTKEILDDWLITRFFYKRANYDFDYREFVDHISILKYHGTADVVYVPSQILDKPVRIVYDNAFCSSHIKVILVPLSISLRQTTFKKCAPNCKIIRF